MRIDESEYHIHPRRKRTVEPRKYQPLDFGFKPLKADEESSARKNEDYRGFKRNERFNRYPPKGRIRQSQRAIHQAGGITKSKRNNTTKH